MLDSVVNFIVTNFHAQLTDGISVQWQHHDIDPGPVIFDLDNAAAHSNKGVLDYGNGRIQAEFAVKLTFPEFADLLNAAGMNPELTEPLHVVIRSEGAILENDGFKMGGTCHLTPHGLLRAEETTASVLPGT